MDNRPDPGSMCRRSFACRWPSNRPSPPARGGDHLAAVDTPALLLDLDAFEHSLDALDALVAGQPVRVRPHATPHKCPEIARLQMAHGAVGDWIVGYRGDRVECVWPVAARVAVF